jgi:PLP dependent protein
MILENISLLKQRIASACKRSGRNPDEIRIIAVSKKATAEDIRIALGCGITAIGESRVLESIDKLEALKGLQFEKHLIGHLQTNKVKAAVEQFDCIQSVDSLKLAKEISQKAAGLNKVMPVMIEVNISGEEQKYGISAMEVEHFYDKLLKLTNIKVVGLMGIAPYVEPEQTRPYFKTLKQINDILKLPNLSMGMSNDFEIAIEEGSNMVRIGTAVFGAK